MTDLGTKSTGTEFTQGDAPWMRRDPFVTDEAAGPFEQELVAEPADAPSCDTSEPDFQTREMIRCLPPFSLETNCGRLVIIGADDRSAASAEVLLSEPGLEPGLDSGGGENLEAYDGERNFECHNYETCLSLAAALDWQSFTCQGCNCRINPKLLWRAHQRLRVEPGLSSYCSLPTLK